MDLRWYVCDLLTGEVLSELPIASTDVITKQLGKADQQTFNLLVLDEKCPEDWTAVLIDGKTMLVLTIDDRVTQGWTVDDHVTGDTTVPIAVSTLETCLARSNVRDLDAFDMDMSQTVAELCAEMPARFGFTVTWTPCGTPTEQEYSYLEDANVLDAVNTLNQTDGGPEWRITLDWADATHRSVTKTIEAHKRIGVDRPDVIFDLDTKGKGVVDTYTRRSSFAADKGATMMIGTGDGSGDSRPMTDPIVSSKVAAGWPIWEERKGFTGLDTAIDEDAELFSRTVGTLAQRENGTVVWTISGNTNAPVPGRDYSEGDTVYIDIAPQGKLDPLGGKTAARALGWSLDPVSGRGTPLLQEDEDDG